jgi:murein L,D-transpeptidase YcbB/YkuD
VLESFLAKYGYIEKSASLTSDVYDEVLVKAIKEFQAQHGLSVDGIIGEGTITAMNRSTRTEIDPAGRWVGIDY